MAAQVCCVDDVRPGTHTIGGRWFCEEHYKKATYHRKGVWRTGLIAVIGLAIFVVAVVVIDRLVRPQLAGVVLVLVGLLLALVPAVVWQIFFYVQDQLEPEPVGDVVRMFVIGLALAGAIGIPLTNQLFAVQTWLYRSTLTTWLASIFVTGTVEAFIVYATVRYFMFDEPEFDERNDGVIYCTAAALGYATALNLQFILSSGGNALGTTEILVTEVALAHAAFGGIMGYFLGRAKLEHDPIWWLPLGLVLTALLGGLFVIARGQLEPSTYTFAGRGLSLPSFNGLILAGVLALVVTIFVSYLIRRDIDRSLSDKQPPVTADPAWRKRQANYATIGVFVIMLAIGGLAWSNAENKTVAFNAPGGIQGSYPSYYSVATQTGDVIRVSDAVGTGSQFVISMPALQAGRDAASVANALAGARSTDFNLYKVLSTGHATVNGKPALTQRFAYVDSNGLTGAAPEVHQGIDYIIVDSGKVIVVTLLSTPDAIPTVEPLFARFLNNLKF